ncbi:transcriptional regulator, IclR family [Noviherbaspirillum humi]|uniref:Transcriptional regulator, IclR family n=1 Tax=Noviherbaspirillum humi TaxID=1688639 RepID=A0A239E6I5_9BURK|nr:IclR family transcriptional regulator [Noviherbaspirillum humi]SNS40276.1 transcriptional regulator, IclR family [Noviherbaspirillum humi]
MANQPTGGARRQEEALLEDEAAAQDAPKSNAKEDRHFVTALARGLEILSCFRSGEKMLGNQELADRSRLPKSTVSRLTYTLTKLGYLDYDGDIGKYRLGTASLALGSAMLSKLDIRQLARPWMQELADFSHATVSLGMRDRLSMIYVENCRSQAALTLRLDVGARIPIALTAMGRAYLAGAPEAERSEILERVREADEYRWPSIQEGVQRSLEEYRTLGCCTSFGDWQADVNAIAVAFRPANGQGVFSINCGGPAFSLKREFLLEEVRPRLLEVAERLRRV